MIFLNSILAFFAYLAIGVGWAFVRWTQFVKVELTNYESVRQRFLASQRIQGTEIPDHLKFEWRQLVERTPRLQIPPDPQDHQRQLVLNVGLWPLSMVEIVVTKVYGLTIQRLIAAYTLTLNSKISNARKDLEK